MKKRIGWMCKKILDKNDINGVETAKNCLKRDNIHYEFKDYCRGCAV